MPRKNKPIKHSPYRPLKNERTKTRYPTERAAEQAAEIRMLQTPNLELAVYQGTDGGWYLTSREN